MDMKNINDVLCGRGGLSNQHPGNRMFRRIVQENKEVYNKCQSKSRKQLLVVSIVEAIKVHGGRFLKKKGDTWVEISNEAACAKTSQALRDSTPDSPSSSGSSSSSSSSSSSRGGSSVKRLPSPTQNMPMLPNVVSLAVPVKTKEEFMPELTEEDDFLFLKEDLDLISSLYNDEEEKEEEPALISDAENDEFEPLDPMHDIGFNNHMESDWQNFVNELAISCCC